MYTGKGPVETFLGEGLPGHLPSKSCDGEHVGLRTRVSGSTSEPV